MIEERSGSFQARFMIKGHTYRETFPTHEEATRYEEDTRLAVKRGTALPTVAAKVGGGDVGLISNTVRSVIAEQWSGRGGRGQLVNAQAFLKWVGKNVTTKEALSDETLKKYVSWLREERGVSTKTLNRYGSMVRSLAKGAGLPTPTAFKHVREGDGRVRFFTRQEYTAIVTFFEGRGLLRERDFFVFLVHTGLRPWGEAERLSWRLVTPSLVTVTSEISKTNHTRHVPLSVQASEAVERQRTLGGVGPWTGLKVRRMSDIWTLVKEAVPSLSDTVWYTARHTCASWQVQAGIPLYDVSKFMGHASIMMTQKYAHFAPEHLKRNLVAFDTEPV